MKKTKYITLSILIFLVISCKNEKTTDADLVSEKFYIPAEWEPQDAVWLGWEPDSTLGFYPVVTKMIKTLTPKVMVKMAFNSDSLMQTAKNYLIRNKVDTTNIKFYTMPGGRYWIRDHGAAFLVNDKGELGVADFGWNHYGYPVFLKEKYNGNTDSINKYLNRRLPSMQRTGKVDSLMANIEGAKILKTDIVNEGGNIEVNGKGTLIVCESAVKHRNPDLTKDYIESEFKRVLGVSKVIWLKQGLADDPNGFFRRITGNYVGGGVQHSDEFVRFSNANTILLAWVDESEKDLNPVNKMNYDRLNESFKILKNATDQDGKPFTIIKVPLPDLITKKITARKEYSEEFYFDLPSNSFYMSEAPKIGDTLLRVPASSYLNYLVTNGVVLASSYVAEGSSKEKEDRVRKIFETQFPDRKIVFINAMPQNWDGGGIHCSTQQQPSKK
ncbi:agmatine deiminase family protein [Mariniflexile sp.]|uniref:agmatine deiminase family protein n=1 Tax=Mariniflexile sp. TaxID=1979402 RepID=UPI004048A015